MLYTCDTHDGIRDYLSRGLEGFLQLSRDRADANGPLQFAWLVGGAFYFDRSGNRWALSRPIRADAVVNVSRIPDGFHFEGIFAQVPSPEDLCSRCGHAWSLQDCSDFVRKGGEALHKTCHAFALEEEVRAEFAEVVGSTGLDTSTLRAIPNLYGSQNYRGPWYLVASPIGDIRIGWRKRVISIAWAEGPDGRKIFADEIVTVYRSGVHAYSYADAKRYLAALLVAGSP